MTKTASGDFEVADIGLAAAGRQDITLAEHEMPGLMALRSAYAAEAPLTGARISGFLHMTVQTAVLIETLVALGAQVRWAGSNRLSTEDHAAAAVAAGPDGGAGVPMFAWKGQSTEDIWHCAEQALSWPDGAGPNLLIDDGGGLTLLLHHGVGYEKTGVLPPDTGAADPNLRAMVDLVRRATAGDSSYWTTLAAGVRGASEQTTTGAHALRRLEADGAMLFAAISVNDSVTKSKFDNRYQCRQSVVEAIKQATATQIGGKLAVVCGYGDVGKGCADALRAQLARVVVTEIDPICAFQAAMDGFLVTPFERVVGEADIVITTTGAEKVVTAEHMSRMKHRAIVGNMGHLDTEIDVEALAGIPGIRRVPARPQVHEWVFEDGRSVIVLSEGRMMNLGNASDHPSFVMSSSLSNQALAQIELFTAPGSYSPGVHALPKILDEKVARLHLPTLGAELTTLTEEQAAQLGVPVDGPYKPDNYRY
ncbi:MULTISPECIES: adenosylhomocysteinase [unclassified Streptomyces]|uniref:adenosylhomocysteinase n=1 Tax=unclassified Streptomyces TaxID=2593676 RepID=UPI00362B3862